MCECDDQIWLSIWHNFEELKKGVSWKNCSYQVGLWACQWGLVLVVNWQQKTHPTVGSTVPRLGPVLCERRLVRANKRVSQDTFMNLLFLVLNVDVVWPALSEFCLCDFLQWYTIVWKHKADKSFHPLCSFGQRVSSWQQKWNYYNEVVSLWYNWACVFYTLVCVVGGMWKTWSFGLE